MSATARTLPPALLLTVVFGCFYGVSHVEEGVPLDDTRIAQIVIDKTTRSEVFELLGTPHSIFHGLVEFVDEKFLDFYLHKEHRFLSTIDNDHYAMLYRFGKYSGRVQSLSAVIVGYENKNVVIHTDELLLLMENQTNIVADIAYRKQSDQK